MLNQTLKQCLIVEFLFYNIDLVRIRIYNPQKVVIKKDFLGVYL